MTDDDRALGSGDPLARHGATPAELKKLLQAEADGSPFMALRDDGGHLQIVVLDKTEEPTLVGRKAGTDIRLPWDREVSGVHAELRLLADEWTIVDDGMSRNGTFLNGDRLTSRRRLADGDRVLIGRTLLAFCQPATTPIESTIPRGRSPELTELSDTQRRILRELCRPQLEADSLRAPASNTVIAERVFLSVDRTKAQLRQLFVKFGLDALPQNQKRAALAEYVLRNGLVTVRDLQDP